MYYRVCSSQSGNRYESQIVSNTSGVGCLLNKSWLVMEMHRAGHSLYRYRVGSSQSGTSYESQIASNTSGIHCLLTKIRFVMEIHKVGHSLYICIYIGLALPKVVIAMKVK